jgi:hypothetical protein
MARTQNPKPRNTANLFVTALVVSSAVLSLVVIINKALAIE